MARQTVSDILKQQIKDLGIDALVANEYDKAMSGVNTTVEVHLFSGSNTPHDTAVYRRKLTRAERREIAKQGCDIYRYISLVEWHARDVYEDCEIKILPYTYGQYPEWQIRTKL